MRLSEPSRMLGAALRGRAGGVLLAALAGMALVAGTALAVIPDGGGVIHACYLKAVGT